MPNGPHNMALKQRTPAAIAAVLLVTLCVLPMALGAGSSSPRTRTPWPKNQGVYTATSSETIPLFSRALRDFDRKQTTRTSGITHLPAQDQFAFPLGVDGSGYLTFQRQ